MIRPVSTRFAAPRRAATPLALALLAVASLVPTAGCGLPFIGSDEEEIEEAPVTVYTDEERKGILGRTFDKARDLGYTVDPRADAAARKVGLVPGKRVYFVTEVNGQRWSSGYRMRTETEWRRGRGRIKAWKIETVSEVERIINGQRLAIESRKTEITDRQTGAALYAYAEEKGPNGSESRTVTVTPAKAIFETRSGEGPAKRSELPLNREVFFNVSPDWILSQGPREGAYYEVPVLDKESKRVMTQRVTVLGAAEREVLGEPMLVWSASVRKPGAADMRMSFTGNGEIVEAVGQTPEGRLVIRVVQKREALVRDAKRGLLTSIPLDVDLHDQELPAWDNFNQMTFRAVLRDRWAPYLSAIDQDRARYMNAEDVGDHFRLTLFKVAPAVDAAHRAYPVRDVPDSLRPYLAAAGNIQANRKEIVRLARSIVGKEEGDALRALAKLVGWVHQNVDWRDLGTVDSRPAETIRQGFGDSTEHADLLASLARAAGIPTRHRVGMLVQRRTAIYHTWIEAWIGHTWVPVDSTVNRVGLPAGYIPTAVGQGVGMASDDFPNAIRQGNIGLQFVSATKRHRLREGGAVKELSFTMLPGQSTERRRSYVAHAGDTWLANLYQGFSLAKPKSWHGNIKLDSVEVASADGTAMVRVEALNHVTQADEIALEEMVNKLRQDLREFRRREAKVIRFPERRPRASLYVDFTFSQPDPNQDQVVRMRGRVYLAPSRGRSYRVSLFAPESRFNQYTRTFESILRTVDL